MKLSSSLSLIAAGAAAGGCAFALAVTPTHAHEPMAWTLLAVPVIAGVTAACGVQWVARREEAELERCRHALEGGETDDWTPRPWVRALAEAAWQARRDQERQSERFTSDRRELERQLRSAESRAQHAQAILSAMSDVVLVTDAFNELVTANEAAQRVLSFDLDTARQKSIEHVIDDPKLLKIIRDMREIGTPGHSRRIEHRMFGNDRSDIYEVTVATVPDDQNEIAGVVTILRDVTREREIADMKSDFVSGVSHELRTPLSSIKAYIEMLVDGEAEDDQTRREFYNIIQSEANRLSRLIDNVLNISRIESGIVRVHREDMSLTSVIREALEVMQPQARARQISLTAQLHSEDCRISGDRDMILQAVLNLMSNAIKYTPGGGRVSLSNSVDARRQTVTIDVTDTGVGIPPEDLPHLWDKFYRVANHKKIAKGTGLGLNLVKHVVETVHQGKVAARSEVGVGSVFSLTLPLLDLDTPPQTPACPKEVMA